MAVHPMVVAYIDSHDALDVRPGVPAPTFQQRCAHGLAAALRMMADEIDRGPTFPLPPAVISQLIRERADSLIKQEE